MNNVDRLAEDTSQTYFVVLCTAPDSEVAAALARSLVHAKLAACVSVVPSVTSFYWWEGEVREEQELLLVAKTDGGRLEDLIATIVDEHPYECPEAIGLEIVAGSSPYLEWISEALS